MASHHHNSNNRITSSQYTQDMGTGFGRFVDEVMRGRSNKTILNSSIGMAALDIGVPSDIEKVSDLEPARMLINNSQINGSLDFEAHPFMDLSLDNLTLLGAPIADTVKQLFPNHFMTPNPEWEKLQKLKEGTPDTGGVFGGRGSDAVLETTVGADVPEMLPYESEHMTPIYDENIATSIGLPDLPYGGLAHFAHMGMAVYDTGRTFQDLWNEPALKHNVFKIMTHPDMTETMLHRGVMLSVMGMLHPLGGVIAIGVGYLCAHLVHTAFAFLNNHKDAVREVMQLPVLKTIYDATGIKEWAEAKDQGAEAQEKIDPLEERNIAGVQLNQVIDKYNKAPSSLLEGKDVLPQGMVNEEALLSRVSHA